MNHYLALTCMIHHRLYTLCEQMLKSVHSHLKLRDLASCDRVIVFKLFSDIVYWHEVYGDFPPSSHLLQVIRRHEQNVTRKAGLPRTLRYKSGDLF